MEPEVIPVSREPGHRAACGNTAPSNWSRRPGACQLEEMGRRGCERSGELPGAVQSRRVRYTTDDGLVRLVRPSVVASESPESKHKPAPACDMVVVLGFFCP